MIPRLNRPRYIPFRRYGIVGLAEGWMSVEGCSGTTHSCQEFVIFAMCYLRDPPLFDMSGLKSLFPLFLCLVRTYFDTVACTVHAVGKYLKDENFD